MPAERIDTEPTPPAQPPNDSNLLGWCYRPAGTPPYKSPRLLTVIDPHDVAVINGQRHYRTNIYRRHPIETTGDSNE